MALPSKVDASPIFVPFSADQSTNLSSAPSSYVGLAATDNNFLVTRAVDTATLNQNLTGETYAFDNPSTAKDAASYNNSQMLQLDTANTIRKVNLSNGSSDVALAISVPNAFGIGYDALSNIVGIGMYDNGNMTFRRIDGTSGTQIGSDVTFTFDSNQYGTPTGLDFVVKGGNQRMLVGTRDGPEIDFSGILNYILDMSASTGNVDQYATTLGSSLKLQDVLYLGEGSIALSYDRPSIETGRIEVGNFAVIPEPSTLLLVGLAGAAGYLANRKKKQ